MGLSMTTAADRARGNQTAMSWFCGSLEIQSHHLIVIDCHSRCSGSVCGPLSSIVSTSRLQAAPVSTRRKGNREELRPRPPLSDYQRLPREVALQTRCWVGDSQSPAVSPVRSFCLIFPSNPVPDLGAGSASGRLLSARMFRQCSR